MTATSHGTIVAAFGRHYEVALPDGQTLSGIPPGKKSVFAVGDAVDLGPESGERAHILRHRPRATLLYRSDAYRQKLIAANATQLLLVVAAEPAFDEDLLSRALVAAENQAMRAAIILNKSDLTERMGRARATLLPFAALGYPVLEISAKADALPLLPLLRGQTSVLVGQSGMGKSTLINALLPEAAAATREISTALDSGKHTTTHARMYALPGGGSIIDSPGLQEFGLAHLSIAEIEYGFIEFRAYLGQCRFRDCRHDQEPACAIRQAVETGNISAGRHRHFRRLAQEAGKRLIFG